MARLVATARNGETDEAERACMDVMIRLVEALLHDARNPLNALAIHAEVLAEKLRRANDGELPPAQEKHISSIKDQVRRIDDVLRRFAPFLGQEGAGSGGDEAVDLAAMVTAAVGVAGHAARRAQVTLEVDEHGPLWARLPHPDRTWLLVGTLVLWGVDFAASKSEVRLEVEHDGAAARIRVRVALPRPEVVARPLPGSLVHLSREVGSELVREGDGASLILPLE